MLLNGKTYLDAALPVFRWICSHCNHFFRNFPGQHVLVHCAHWRVLVATHHLTCLANHHHTLVPAHTTQIPCHVIGIFGRTRGTFSRGRVLEVEMRDIGKEIGDWEPVERAALVRACSPWLPNPD